MAELKRDFSGAKMNKDMDERVLPPGQYRDAINIQIATSDGADVGSLQTLLGNTEVTEDVVPEDYCTCVGYLNLPEKDLIYYFVSGGGYPGYNPSVRKDYIIEYNTILRTTRYIFVDIYSATHTVTADTAAANYFKILAPSGSNDTGVRIGMKIQGTFNDPSSVNDIDIGTTANFNTTVTDITKDGGNWRIYHSGLSDYANATNNFYASIGDEITFDTNGDRVLNFIPWKKITAINHLDGMIFWTDNNGEPKKIHIERSVRGTGGLTVLHGWNDTIVSASQTVHHDLPFADAENGANFHTRLTRKRPTNSNSLIIARTKNNSKPIWVQEKHITVIKKSPLFPLELEMATTASNRTPTGSSTGNPIFATVNTNFWDSVNSEVLGVGATGPISANSNVDWRIGDILMFTNNLLLSPDNFADDKTQARARIIAAPNAGGAPDIISNGPFTVEIMSVDPDLGSTTEDFYCKLEQEKPLFEYKFPRFSYRWKYTDGEYSCFAPWSEVAFLPGDFDYLPKKGYNLGMTNNLRYLKLKNYFMEYGMVPEDVVGVDLLYKESGRKTVYTVKELTEKDPHPIWPDRASSNWNRGEFVIDSELIHSVIPSNQLLRPWDNVPRVAKCQEITSNRIVYGNYKQNYTIDETLKLNISHASYPVPDNAIEDYEIPLTSCKSLRTYQIGVVWLDKFGRESPVMVPAQGGSITIPKSDSVNQNKIKVSIVKSQSGGGEPPSWAKYLKYYIKETSNEYYNLAMDRFYDAEDNNIWLSFPSAERNKIDVNSYMYLKKQHDNAIAVVDKARYKCIAVENEAPLFIKKKKKTYGRNTIEFSPTGLPESGRMFILVKKDDFEASFSQAYEGTDMQIQIIGVDGSNVIVSETYTIVGISKGSTWNKIIFGEFLGTECDPIAALTPSQDMKIEIFHYVFEDKPEFDGRFFVKILKDLTLEKELLSTFAESFRYNTIDTMQLGYWHSHSGRNESWYERWKHKHTGNYQSRENRWVIDDQDTSGNIATREINRGGIYNTQWEGDVLWQGVTYAHGGWKGDYRGNGWIDLAYGSYSNEGVSKASGFTPAWNRLKQIGCLFRFKQDPAQTVFEIKGYKGRLGYNGKGGDDCTIWGLADITNHGYKTSNWNSEKASAPFIPGAGAGDYDWNYDRSNGNNDNQRWSARIKVDKMFGSGPNHIFDSSIHCPMNKPDPANPGEWIPMVDGDKYGVAIKASADGNHAQGHEHNWFPITSATGYELNTANEIVPNHGNHSWPATFNGVNIKSPLKDPTNHAYDPVAKYCPSIYNTGHSEYNMHNTTIEFLEPVYISTEIGGGNWSSTNPAIWETEPKEDIGLDIYYEASGAMPIDVTHEENELLIPLGSKIIWNTTEYTVTAVNSWDNAPYITVISLDTNLGVAINHGTLLRITRFDNSTITCMVNNAAGAVTASGQNKISLTTGSNALDLDNFGDNWYHDNAPHHLPMELAWHNCWVFGNGVESDRIRDDFNAPQLDNGVKASTILSEPYAEEHRSSGLIWSGIFNSTSGVNNLNQFIQAEPITKDLNPNYGSLQKLVARNTDTLAFCEDKVLRLMTDKDALYKADGDPQLVASNKVIGQSIPIQGEFGISTNPESLTSDPDGFYWCDQMRGQVLTLKGNQIVSISDIGMKDWFNDNLQDLDSIVGTYDEKKKEYNITLGGRNIYYQAIPTTTTLSFNQITQGWTSFKSFGPEDGTSLNNEYYTWNKGSLWRHHAETATRNNFYGTQYASDVTLIFNDNPGSVKSFNTVNYEGTQCQITPFTSQSVTNASGTTWTIDDDEYYNLLAKDGWYIESIITNLQEIGELEFKNKEGKWFSTIQGVSTELSNLDEREFSVQGLGYANSVTTGAPDEDYNICVNPCALPTDPEEGETWDDTTDSALWGWSLVLPKPVGIAGATIPAGYVDITLTNITLGLGGVMSYSGLNLYASNFSTPNGTATTTGSGNSTVYIYTDDGDWNADPEVLKVEYTNNGIAGDPGNTVNCRVHYTSFTMPSEEKSICFDIDHSGTENLHGIVYRDTCFNVSYMQLNATSNPIGEDNVAITYTDLSVITETANTGFKAPPKVSNNHEGSVDEAQSTLVAEYMCEADAGYYLSPVGNGPVTGLSAQYYPTSLNMNWSNAYDFFYTNEYWGAPNDNKIKKTTLQIYYTPPQEGDPINREGGFCSWLHDIGLIYNALSIESTETYNNVEEVTSVYTTSSIVTSEIGNFLSITATADGDFKLTVTESGGKYCTFTYNDGVYTGTWGTSSTPTTISILEEESPITIPILNESSPTTTAITYNAWCTAIVSDLTLNTNVPDATGELQWTVQSPVTSVSKMLDTITNASRDTLEEMGEWLGVSGTQLLTNITIPVQWRFSADAGYKFTINNQPEDSDLIGGTNSYALTAITALGATTLTIGTAAILGIQVGMVVTYPNTGTAFTTNTVVSSVNAGAGTLVVDKITLEALAIGDEILFNNGWKYSMNVTVRHPDDNTVMDTTSTIATAVAPDLTKVIIGGTISLNKFGTTNQDVTLQPNFLTVSLI